MNKVILPPIYSSPLAVTKQRRVAHELLQILEASLPDYRLVIAGGAVRSWYLGELAKDIDVVAVYKGNGVPQESVTEKLTEDLRITFSGHPYADATFHEIVIGEFEGYEFNVLTTCDSLAETMQRFPLLNQQHFIECPINGLIHNGYPGGTLPALLTCEVLVGNDNRPNAYACMDRYRSYFPDALIIWEKKL